MKKLFTILILSLITFITNDVCAFIDTNITKESHIWIKNNSEVPLTLFVKRIEVLIPDSSINYFCWGSCYPPFISISTDMVTILAGEMDTWNFIGDYVIKSGAALIDTAKITYCFIDNCDTGNFQCFTASYSLTGPMDSLYQMLVFDTNGCKVTTNIYTKEIENSMITDNRVFDVLGREIKYHNSIPIGTIYIQNRKKLIKIK